jgi:DNA-binding MarR family transcriptional regulator/GNAT superfamily N-acetyltransferase
MNAVLRESLMIQHLQTIDAVRAFSRFYTARLGVVGTSYLGTHYTLTDARIIFELNARPHTRAVELIRELGIDPSYLSRIVARFRNNGLVSAMTDPEDARNRILTLTDTGRAEAARLADLSRREIGTMIGGLTDGEAQTLEHALRTVERYLSEKDRHPPAYTLRPHQAGDMGWIIESQSAFYEREYGWNGSFEALVADVTSQFLKTFNPLRERAWIAERDGLRIGSVMVTDGGDDVAKLRLLYVDEAARGLGLGTTLVDSCIAFASEAGYKKLSLWTNHPLTAARAIYARKGFSMVSQSDHSMFGPLLTGETWELNLSGNMKAQS